ncbi:MAG: DJ-1/PfpI family protein [Myxococcales bacterium]|jgi:transcriptional regulator GlxA family with amidase domain
MTTIGIVVFDDAEELDFVGPWEVFCSAGMMIERGDAPGAQPLKAVLIAEKAGPVRCAKGMRVLPDATFADAPPLDLVLVPGGMGTRREANNQGMLAWLREIAPRCRFVTSVCTGALLLHEAGISRGRRVATHFNFVEQLRARGANVLTNVRYVEDGNLISAAGVSAGIDMSLWLVGQLVDPKFARKVQRWIEYDPKPPYADVQI